MRRLAVLALVVLVGCASSSAVGRVPTSTPSAATVSGRTDAPATGRQEPGVAPGASAAPPGPSSAGAGSPALALDLVAVLPAPPLPGSDDAKADIGILLWLQRTRTAADVERARAEVKLGFPTFAPVLGPGFDPAAHPRTQALLRRAAKPILAAMDAAKERFHRPRPYDADARVTPAVEREPSLSYPSGHSIFGVVLSRILAELAPDRRDALLRAGLQIGYDRVIGGVHYPSDVLAGQQAGTLAADRVLADPEFRRELDDVKRAEWR